MKRPTITVAGRIGVSLVAYAACQLDPSPTLLYGMSAVGVVLILWEAVTYGAKLLRANVVARPVDERKNEV
jgi:hypothetical protein